MSRLVRSGRATLGELILHPTADLSSSTASAMDLTLTYYLTKAHLGSLALEPEYNASASVAKAASRDPKLLQAQSEIINTAKSSALAALNLAISPVGFRDRLIYLPGYYHFVSSRDGLCCRCHPLIALLLDLSRSFLGTLLASSCCLSSASGNFYFQVKPKVRERGQRRAHLGGCNTHPAIPLAHCQVCSRRWRALARSTLRTLRRTTSTRMPPPAPIPLSPLPRLSHAPASISAHKHGATRALPAHAPQAPFWTFPSVVPVTVVILSRFSHSRRSPLCFRALAPIY